MSEKPKFIGWIETPRYDAPRPREGQGAGWEKIGKLFATDDGSRAIMLLWGLPAPGLNRKHMSIELKAFCRPHPDKAWACGSLPDLSGDVMLPTEKFVGDNGEEKFVKRKVGYILSREGESGQYFAIYFLFYPAVKMSDKGGVWLHVHLDSFESNNENRSETDEDE